MRGQGSKLLISKEKYQLIYSVEHIFLRIVIPVVVGSSPISHPNKIKDLAQKCSKSFFFSEFM
jgi:hypothetical protein